MKIHRVVQMLGATTSTGKLASDMYDLNYETYYSEAEGRDIPISHMDFQHMVRAFVKQNAKANDVVSKEAYQVMWDNCKESEKQVKHYKKLAEDNFISSVNDSETSSIWKERYEKEVDNAEYWRKQYYDSVSQSTKGHYYTFSEIPQDAEGKEFVKNCRKYLNRDSYKIRTKGQHLKKELYGQGKAYHGANMEDCSHMRVYIDKKRGDE